MAEYIRYKGQRYKKIDEQCERVDTLDRRIEEVKTELTVLCKRNKAFSANGKIWRHRLYGKDRCMFVLSGFSFEETESNTFRVFLDKLTTDIKRFLNKKNMAFLNYKPIKQSGGTYELAIPVKIKNLA